jgi:hypothetical protein
MAKAKHLTQGKTDRHQEFSCGSWHEYGCGIGLQSCCQNTKHGSNKETGCATVNNELSSAYENLSISFMC